MFVVPVQTLWLMTSIQAHEELLEGGTLIRFEESLGQALFISHQWAGLGHPDPHFLQLKVLQDALRNLLSGNSSISASMVMELLAGQQHGVCMHHKLADRLFVWYDYFCCPQANVVHRQSAIDSIPAYVGRCQIFCILCPHVRHADDNTLLNKHTWAERGTATCSTELSQSRAAIVVTRAFALLLLSLLLLLCCCCCCMYADTCAWISVCLSVCLRLSVCVCLSVCLSVCQCLYVCMYACINVCTDVWM